ncbi:MAG TPA: ATPase domain-containing protein [Polyangiaceae bacterium]|nr:ATPase domain-containing protein [Polyangiaceae bacterium]
MTQGTQQANDGRLESGIAGLDQLLDGGFVSGGVYLIMGAPGTGKTTLGNQCCFALSTRGQKAVYLSLLTESQSRMLANLQAMSFFDEAAIGSSITYVGGYLVLRERRLPGLFQLIRKLVADEQPKLLVIDGVTASVRDGEAGVREFIADLQLLSDTAGCTTLLLANMNSADANSAEHSMVDGMLELSIHHMGQRAFREIEVLKCRGVNHFLGGHELEITENGVIVRPRTELSLVRRARVAPPTQSTRLATGIQNLDTMLGGGLLSGSATMLLGFAGSGKTLLASHFLDAGARAQEPGLYFGFYESPARLTESAEQVGLAFAQHAKSGLIELEWQPPLRYSLDALAERLLANVRRRRVRRLVIDGLDGLRQSAFHPERTIRFVAALCNELRSENVTLLVTEETQKIFGPEVEVRIEGISALVDNILLLEYLDLDSELKRLISIVKQRGSSYETAVRELRISERGITLANDSASAAAIIQHGRESRRGHRDSPESRRDTHGSGR